MKVYQGGRSLMGATVTVDGRPLSPRFDLKTYSPAGFEWTYEGDGPRQLALAMLADHFGSDSKAIEECETFMKNIVANLDNAWRLTTADVEKGLKGNH